jgi:hypothetical protein
MRSITNRTSITASKAVHYKSQPIARSKKQSAVYYAAYVTGTPLHDVSRDKIFWRKDTQGDVLHWEIVGPKGAEDWTLAELWNGAEAAAKKINERPGRQTQIAMPHELCQGDMEAAKRVARGHCLWLRDQYGIASTWALHAPNPDAHGESTKNWHIHIVETDRKMSINAQGRPEFGAKVRELTDGKQGRIELERRRKDWEKRVNRELQLGGFASRVNLGKAALGDGADYIPGAHRGPKLNAMLRKHQAATRTAMSAGRALPQAPKRLAAFFAYAEARQAANAANRSFWEATGRALSQIGNTAAKMTEGEGAAARGAAGHPLVSRSTLEALTIRDTPPDQLDDQSQDDTGGHAEKDQARAREVRAWEKYWEEEGRKAAAHRGQRQRTR